jgi:hypothetical protein
MSTWGDMFITDHIVIFACFVSCAIWTVQNTLYLFALEKVIVRFANLGASCD